VLAFDWQAQIPRRATPPVEQGLAQLVKDKCVKFVSTDAVLSATKVITSGS
jgi:hypothetical protein